MKRALPLALAALLLAACKARKDFPEPGLGWHSPSFSVVFGRLQRIPAAEADAPPTWALRFGTPNDTYEGELALTPPERLVGYSGGEPVEIRGHVLSDPAPGLYNGRTYVVDSIQLWSGYRQ
jgi:hypothetical protein